MFFYIRAEFPHSIHGIVSADIEKIADVFLPESPDQIIKECLVFVRIGQLAAAGPECGSRCLGESKIFYAKKVNDCRIRQVRLVPEHPKALPASLEAIRDADLIIMGPGSLYTSIIPNFLVDGISEAVADSKALKILVMNIMTQDGESEGYTGADHVRALLRHGLPGIVDVCIANCRELPAEVLGPYHEEGVGMLELDEAGIESFGIGVRKYELATGSRYIRHDHVALANAIMEVYREATDR